MWFAAIVSGKYGKMFNGRVMADDQAGAAEKYLGLCPGADMSRVEFIEDPKWEISSRPGDAAAIMAAETGMDYSAALVACNMD